MCDWLLWYPLSPAGCCLIRIAIGHLPYTPHGRQTIAVVGLPCLVCTSVVQSVTRGYAVHPADVWLGIFMLPCWVGSLLCGEESYTVIPTCDVGTLVLALDLHCVTAYTFWPTLTTMFVYVVQSSSTFATAFPLRFCWLPDVLQPWLVM